MTMNVREKGKVTRKFYQLDLERDHINMLAMSWTVVHPLDDNSPIRNMTEKEFEESDPEFLIFVKAVNDTNSQLVHARTSYKGTEIIWGAKFASIFEKKHNHIVVHVNNINEHIRTPSDI